MEKDKENLLNALNMLWNNFNNCRAHLPAVSKEAVGSTTIRTAPNGTKLSHFSMEKHR